MAKERVVLPTSVTPKHYSLVISTNFSEFTFEGNVEINAVVHQPTTTVVLNANDLKINSARITQNGKAQELTSDSIVLNEKDETVTLTLAQELSVGEATLSIPYVGNLNDQMKGYYRSQYKATGTEEQRIMGCTQFEPTDARRALPCWDEPVHKATFSVTLTIPKAMNAISNMPEVSRKDEGESITIGFEKTPKMSTYLLAWVVGELEHIELEINKTHNPEQKTLIRVLTVKGRSEEGRFALDVTRRTLPFYERYFGSDYPLPKADLIAIPDFAAGAMENWGLVTYRETCLLCTQKSSAFARQRVTLVVAHELAHQWFGNLVTMDWWKELWLNEGFANFIEYLATNELFPEWQIWTQFVNDELGRALELDALETSHAIEVEVYHAHEVDEIFDAISYSKGSVVVRMIQSYVGAENFRKALVKYLAHFSYGNATTKDLWDFLARESGQPVAEIMHNWTSRKGYPVLTVEAGAAAGELRVSQRQFIASGEPAKDPTVWVVPFLVRTAADVEPKPELLRGESAVLNVPVNAKFVKLNAGQTSAVRVKYSDDLLAKLTAAVQANELGPIDRLGVIKDTEALATAGLQSSASLLSFLRVFAAEQDYTVWCAVAQSLGSVAHLIEDNEEASHKFAKFAAGLFEKKGVELGWSTEGDHLTNMLRALVLAQLVRYEHGPTVHAARQKFDEYVRTGEAPPADLRTAIYSAAVAQGGADEWHQVKKWYLASTDAEEKVRCLRVLAKTKDRELLSDCLAFAMSTDVRSQDAVSLIEAVAANRVGLGLAWDFLRNSWTQLREKYGPGIMLSRVVKLVGNFTSEEKAAEAEAWWATVRDVAVARSINQAFELARSTTKWRVRDAAGIVAWLEAL